MSRRWPCLRPLARQARDPGRLVCDGGIGLQVQRIGTGSSAAGAPALRSPCAQFSSGCSRWIHRQCASLSCRRWPWLPVHGGANCSSMPAIRSPSRMAKVFSRCGSYGPERQQVMRDAIDQLPPSRCPRTRLNGAAAHDVTTTSTTTASSRSTSQSFPLLRRPLRGVERAARLPAARPQF